MSAMVLKKTLKINTSQTLNVLFYLKVEIINHLLFCPFGLLIVLWIQIFNTILWLSARPPSSQKALLREFLRYILALAQPGQFLSTKQLHFLGSDSIVVQVDTSLLSIPAIFAPCCFCCTTAVFLP